MRGCGARLAKRLRGPALGGRALTLGQRAAAGCGRQTWEHAGGAHGRPCCMELPGVVPQTPAWTRWLPGRLRLSRRLSLPRTNRWLPAETCADTSARPRHDRGHQFRVSLFGAAQVHRGRAGGAAGRARRGAADAAAPARCVLAWRGRAGGGRRARAGLAPAAPPGRGLSASRMFLRRSWRGGGGTAQAAGRGRGCRVAGRGPGTRGCTHKSDVQECCAGRHLRRRHSGCRGLSAVPAPFFCVCRGACFSTRLESLSLSLSHFCTAVYAELQTGLAELQASTVRCLSGARTGEAHRRVR